MKKLFMFCYFCLVLSPKSYGILLPSPVSALDSRLENKSLSLTERRKIVILQTGKYYDLYISEFKKLNNFEQDPFPSNTKENILKYIEEGIPAQELYVPEEESQITVKNFLNQNLFLGRASNYSDAAKVIASARRQEDEISSMSKLLLEKKTIENSDRKLQALLSPRTHRFFYNLILIQLLLISYLLLATPKMFKR